MTKIFVSKTKGESNFHTLTVNYEAFAVLSKTSESRLFTSGTIPVRCHRSSGCGANVEQVKDVLLQTRLFCFVFFYLEEVVPEDEEKKKAADDEQDKRKVMAALVGKIEGCSVSVNVFLLKYLSRLNYLLCFVVKASSIFLPFTLRLNNLTQANLKATPLWAFNRAVVSMTVLLQHRRAGPMRLDLPDFFKENVRYPVETRS